MDAAMSDKDGSHGKVRAVLVIRKGRTLVENYYHSQASDHHNIYPMTSLEVRWSALVRAPLHCGVSAGGHS
jgi:hypothetical protein